MTSVVSPSSLAPGPENRPPNQPAWRENLNVHLICPDCQQNPPDLLEENSDTICGNCGRVLAERLISYESEWRTFNTDEKGGDDPNRVGDAENDLLFGNSGTTIGGNGPNMSKETRKLKKAQAMQNEDKNNKQLQTQYAQIDAWGESDHFPLSVKTGAKQIYKQIFEAQAFRGKNNAAVLASCLFIACRSNKVQRSFAEIMNLTKVPKKEIGRTYKAITNFLQESASQKLEEADKLGERPPTEAANYQAAQSGKREDLVLRYCNMLGLVWRVHIIAKSLVEKCSNVAKIAGKSPLSIVSACIYFAAHLLGQSKTPHQVSQVTSVSAATIQQAYKLVLAEKDWFVEKEWLGEQPITATDGKVLIGKMSNLPSQ